MVDPREMPSVNDLEYGESDPLLINEELSPYELLQNNDKDINRSGSVAHEDTLAHEKSGKYPIQQCLLWPVSCLDSFNLTKNFDLQS
mgnify:FL=1